MAPTPSAVGYWLGAPRRGVASLPGPALLPARQPFQTGDYSGGTALNAIEIEVLEATRGVAEFQRDATALAKKLCEELPQKRESALAVALDALSARDHARLRPLLRIASALLLWWLPCI